jgi:hypothetical protein
VTQSVTQPVPTPGIWPLATTAVLLAILLGLSPLAMSFEPYGAIARDGVWAGSYVQDPSYAGRAALILFGLASALASALLTAAVLRHGVATPQARVQISMAVACWAIGWRSYPYWVNGVFQAGRAVGLGTLDPKALPPMSWIGEFWRLSTLLLYPVAFGAAVLLVAIAVRALWSDRRAWPLAVGVCSMVTLATLVYCPFYGVWLLD